MMLPLLSREQLAKIGYWNSYGGWEEFTVRTGLPCPPDRDKGRYEAFCHYQWSAFAIQWICIAWCMLVGTEGL